MVNSGQNKCANDISLNKACEGIWLARDEQFITLNKFCQGLCQTRDDEQHDFCKDKIS